jgi:hypothetical protein
MALRAGIGFVADPPGGGGKADSREEVGEVLEGVEEGVPEKALGDGEEVGRKEKGKTEEKKTESRDPLTEENGEYDRGADDTEDQADQLVRLYPVHDGVPLQSPKTQPLRPSPFGYYMIKKTEKDREAAKRRLVPAGEPGWPSLR